MKATDHLYAVLLAGGKGTRFWPLSRSEHPKQLLKLFSDKTLLEETYDRITPLVPEDRIYIATVEQLAARIRTTSFHRLAEENIILEPIPRNTAPCIAVAAKKILKKDPDAIIAVLPSDHFVKDTNTFLEVMEAAAHYAAKGRIVTLGLQPITPETGYGYIRFGDFIGDTESVNQKYRARAIQAFVEKPDRQTAMSYLEDTRYLWNSGIFVFRADTMLEQVKEHLPDLATCVNELENINPKDSKAIKKCWEAMPSISIDYGVMEKAQGLLVIPSSFGWSDVGTWNALGAFPNDASDNFTHGDVIAIDTANSVLYCDEGLLVTLGMENVVVVSTNRVVMVCPTDRTQEVRRIIDELKARNKGEYS